ncbi:hypothetical protein [Bacillus alkalicellulosilyticus]|uniref:hypothetical protein n=1 Tax=Alkalihalobacterium alkalicellulosilyticum TaxID=1912214 RepID=UPI000996172E|nr:hypothetical protein [Bacillus alkalicellulosilyticus]
MNSLLHWFWMNGVFFILYGLLALSSLYTIKNIIEAPIKERIHHWNYRNRLRKMRAIKMGTSYSFKNPALKHIYLLIKTTSKENTDQNVFSYIVITLFLFGFTFITIFIKFFDFFLAFLLGALIAIIPYMLLQIKLRKLRFVMGGEFLAFIQNLTQHYNANHHDMYHALVETQKTIESKELRQLLLKLISDLQVSKNEEELKMSISVFVYATGTSWAKRLGNIIIKSYLYNENVLSTLLTLTRQIEDTEEMLEQEKSNTIDAVMNGYLTVPIFIFSIIVGYYVSAAQDWFSLQFGNDLTLTLFIFCVIGVIFSVFISMILKRPKNDI